MVCHIEQYQDEPKQDKSITLLIGMPKIMNAKNSIVTITISFLFSILSQGIITQPIYVEQSSLSLITNTYASVDGGGGKDEGGGDDGGDEGGKDEGGGDDGGDEGGKDESGGDEGGKDEGGDGGGEGSATTTTFTDESGQTTTTTTSCGSGGCSTAESWFNPRLANPTPQPNVPSPPLTNTLNPSPQPTVKPSSPITPIETGVNETVTPGGLNINKTFDGTLTLKKIFYDTKKLIPGAIYSLAPNPYDTKLKSCLIVNDNDKNDFNRTNGVVMLRNMPYLLYNIKETLHSSACGTDHIIHETNISINENLPHPVVNIVENQNLGRALSDEVIPFHYIVMLNDSMLSLDGDDNISNNSPLSIANEFISRGAKLIHLYEYSFNGFSLYIPSNELLNQIMNDPRISSVEQDKLGHFASTATTTAETNQPNTHMQTVPTGIQRIGSESTIPPTNTSAVSNNDNNNAVTTVSTALRPQINQEFHRATEDIDVDIAIIDSGISKSHPELNVYRDVTFVNGTSSGNDGAGHGSHAAGTVAARDNSMGVIGVAPGARLWAVKVCYDTGRCPVSNQIAAMEYLQQHADEIDVANISLENPRSKLLDRAVNKVVSEAGITIIAAAGNSARDTKFNSPARSPDVIAVSAIADSDGKCGGLGRITVGGADDHFANFSNYGSAVDFAAPGVDILSTYNGDEYSIESGTSMSASHVTGSVALYKARNPDATPAEVKSALIETAASPETPCNGYNYGYFSEDVDDFKEPLLFVNLAKIGFTKVYRGSTVD